MATIYFLAIVAVCAVGLIWLLSRSGKSRAGSSRRRAVQHTQPLYEHRTAGHSLGHSHGHPPWKTRDIWHTPRPRVTDERWEQTGTLTASRIRSDADADEAADEEITMSAIEYTPEEVEIKRSTGTKR